MMKIPNMHSRFWRRKVTALADGALAPDAAMRVQAHMACCPDCAAHHERIVRLKKLLALKRYEQPSPAYFERFPIEFHRRQQLDLLEQPPVWERVREKISLEPSLGLRYAAATAVVLVLAINLMIGLRQAGKPALLATESGPVRVKTASVLNEITAAPADLRHLIQGRTALQNPHYVLDSITVTPVQYVAHVQF
jgi:anti-sigma factor RsiW